MSTLSDIKTLKTEINKLREEAKKKVEEIFKVAALSLFVEYPNLKRISWTQYTPYFDDGDPCTFSSTHNCPAIYFTTTVNENKDEDEDDFDNYEEEWYESSYFDYSKDYKTRTLKTSLTDEQINELKTGQAVKEFLNNFDNEDMENLFGDGYKVIITKNKIEVEEFSHD